ncbi:MAG: DUF1800 family protein [Dermatophilaceae bacterium]
MPPRADQRTTLPTNALTTEIADDDLPLSVAGDDRPVQPKTSIAERRALVSASTFGIATAAAGLLWPAPTPAGPLGAATVAARLAPNADGRSAPAAARAEAQRSEPTRIRRVGGRRTAAATRPAPTASTRPSPTASTRPSSASTPSAPHPTPEAAPSRPSSRPAAQKPAAAHPAADRDSSYRAASDPGRGRTGAPRSSVALAARSIRTARLAVPAGIMAPELVAQGLRNTPVADEHLLARTTFGARPSDRAAVRTLGLDGWLARQLAPTALPDPEGDKIRAAFPLAGKTIADVRSSVPEFSWDAAVETGQMTLGLQLHSSRQLYEVVVDVFANLLHVTVPSDNVWDCGPDYLRTVIRAHAFGRFEDMLLASMRHPAMLRYLNNDESTKTNVNENLGRELLELHTVGVLSGYTEADVRNSAYLLTGRRFVWETGAFRYDANRHWTGPVKVLGFEHANATGAGGIDAGDDYLRYLARHPQTAQTVARKLAVRFVSDAPPASLVDRLAETYLRSGTAILPMLRALFFSTEFWSAPQAKTRRPLEDAVGAGRAVDVRVNGDVRAAIEGLYWNLRGVGHAPLAWTPPDGYPDVGAAWQSAATMVRRWNTHRGLAHSWGDNMRPPELLRRELRPAPGMTYGLWVDVISHRVLGRALDGPRKQAILTFLQATATTIVPAWMTKPTNDVWIAPEVAALMLDGPHHQLR